MTTPELIDFVKNDIAKGVSRSDIANKLKMQGWDDRDIIEVFDIVLRISNVSNQTEVSNIPVEINENINSDSPAINTTVEPIILHSENRFQSYINPIKNIENTDIDKNNEHMSYDSVKEEQLPQLLKKEQPLQPLQPLQSIPAINTMGNAIDSLQQPKSSKKILKIFLAFLIMIIVLLGGFVLYASGYFVNPSKLFSQWIDSSKNNTSASFEVNLNIDASGLKLDNENESSEVDKYKVINFSMKGATDYADEKNIKFYNTLSFKAADIEADIESRMINQSIYLNIIKAPTISFFSLKSFENKWISIPVKDESGNLAGNPLLSMSPIDSSLIDDITEEQKLRISEIINDASFIKITKKHLPVIIDGSLSYHFNFDLDKEGIISFAKDMVAYINSQNNDIIDTSTISDDDYDKAFQYINSFNGEAWIGIFDKLPHKMVIDLEVINPEKREDGVAKISLSAIYSNWNKPVSVEVPLNSMTVEELMAQVMGGMFGSSNNSDDNNKIENLDDVDITIFDDSSTVEISKEKSIDASTRSIMTNMLAQAEIFYNLSGVDSYKGFCTSKSEYGAYQLAKTLPENSVYKCRDEVSKWSAYVKLSDNSYWCSDSSGYSSSVKNIPTRTSCFK